jgi:hypothetical protein
MVTPEGEAMPPRGHPATITFAPDARNRCEDCHAVLPYNARMPRLLLILGLYVVCGTASADNANAAAWSIRVTPDDQVFPALELSQAARDAIPPQDGAAERPDAAIFGAGSGLIAVRLRARHAGERVRLQVDSPGLATPAHLEVTLAQTGRSYELHPPLVWNAQVLARDLVQPAELRFALQRDGADAGVRMHRVSLRPLFEALYFVRDGRDQVDLSWIFAAYVNERDPVVDQILELALKSGIVEKFNGYESMSPAQVRRQVWAIWQALAAHGIRYSDADPGIARGPREFSQRVHLLEQTWAGRTANCIDGSVLIASVLQRIGLRSFLVLVPGHAFVGFYLDAESEQTAYLETTLLGAPPPRLAEVPEFAQTLGEEFARATGIAGFAAALASGRARYARAQNKLDGRNRPDYALIDVAAARAFGIVPIVLEPIAPQAASASAASSKRH